MSSKGKFALLVGLAAGIATGVLFAPESGKKFREKVKKEIKTGGYGEKSLWKHFKGVAAEVKETAKEKYETSKLEAKIEKAGQKLEQAKSAAKGSVKIAKNAIKDIKHELKG